MHERERWRVILKAAARPGVATVGELARATGSSPATVRRDLAKLAGRAERIVVLADSTTFRSRGGLILCPLSRIHTIITDDAVDPAAVAMFRDAGVEGTIVPVSGHAASAA